LLDLPALSARCIQLRRPDLLRLADPENPAGRTDRKALSALLVR
jgi:hypothetical protein